MNPLTAILFLSFCVVILATVMLMAIVATKGYQGDGARYGRYQMIASVTITKGEVVALDATPELIVATAATHELIVGVAIETKTSLASGAMFCTVCSRGIVEVLAKGNIAGGDRVRGSTTNAGEVMARVIPVAAGANPTQAEYAAAWEDEFANLGIALDDIADAAYGNILVNKN